MRINTDHNFLVPEVHKSEGPLMHVKRQIEEEIAKGKFVIEFKAEKSEPINLLINNVNRALKELELREKYSVSILDSVVRIELNKDK
jgi:hypothetical protein